MVIGGSVGAPDPDDDGGVYDRTAIGEEVKPQGVESGGSRANWVKGGDGKEERPVPPMMAIGILSILQYAPGRGGDGQFELLSAGGRGGIGRTGVGRW